MLIDWFTVVAQAVNFLILVWLLKRLLYKPVLAAIDTREKRIAAQLADAAHREAQARTEREEYQRRNQTLAQEREAILRTASDAADAERQRLLEAARLDAQMLRSRLTEVLTQERQELGRQLVSRSVAEVFQWTRKALTDLAGVGVEGRMVEVFMDRLRALPEELRHKLVSATVSGPGNAPATRTAIVRSAFDLKVPQRAAIEQVIGECFGPRVSIRFEHSAELVCGIELTLDGVKLAWSVTDYLTHIAPEGLELPTQLSGPTSAAETPVSDITSREARHG
jgi:F-type H+-transporting ATPase subunit b